MGQVELRRIDDTQWEIPRRDPMRVPARIFADRELLDAIADDRSLEQLANVATLPGIVEGRGGDARHQGLTVYRWVEHTGELELEIEAESERGVFEQGFEAMRELLEAENGGEPSRTRRLALRASDRPAGQLGVTFTRRSVT